MNYTASQKAMTFAIGCLIAWQGVPSEFKKAIPNLPFWEIGTSVLLGGLYALEKLLSKPHSEDADPEKP